MANYHLFNCIWHMKKAFMPTLMLFACITQIQSADIYNCAFEDTANITSGFKFLNGSYLYEGIIIPAELIGTYNYEIVHGEEQRIDVAPHVRGCICKLKSCVKFCCHPKQLKIDMQRECSSELAHELNYSPYVNITFHNGSQLSVHVLDEFAVQQGIPCHDAYTLVPQESEDDNWELFENGTLLRMYDMAYLSKQDYCLTPHKVNGTYFLNPMNCPVYYEAPETEKLNSIAMLISIPFLLLTAFVYMFVPKLRNLHGKCLICYLISLAIGYSMMVIISLSNIQFSDHICSTLGFTAYFFFMSAFFWLSVISFDLWYNFSGTKGNIPYFLQTKRFYIYSLYAWGLPVLMTILTILAQLSAWDENWKPGIGGEYCWLKPDDWSAMIYFYGPNLLIILFNVTMFISTFLKIYRVKRELERIVAREESMRHLGTQKDNYALFLRLFIVMGVTWLLEVASYMVGSRNLWSKFFYLTDFCNAAHGVIIFVLFVLRRKVKVLIKKRMYAVEDETKNNDKYRMARKSLLNAAQTSTTSLTKVT